MSHLVIDVDNSPITFYGISSHFENLDLNSKNGYIGFVDQSHPTINELTANVQNGAIVAKDGSRLITTKSTILSTKNGQINTWISGPSLTATSSNGAVRLLVSADDSSSAITSASTLTARTSSGSIDLTLLSPSHPLTLTAHSRAGSVHTSLISPRINGRFHLETRVGSLKAEGDLQITRSKKGVIGGEIEGIFGSGDDQGETTIDMGTEMGSTRFWVGKEENNHYGHGNGNGNGDEGFGDDNEEEWEEIGDGDGRQHQHQPHHHGDNDNFSLNPPTRHPLFYPLLAILIALVIGLYLSTRKQRMQSERIGYVRI